MRARASDCTRSTAASAVRPVIDGLAQAPQPAAVVGEHAVGFEHVAVRAGVGDLAPFQHAVEIGLQRADRILQARELLLRRRRR